MKTVFVFDKLIYGNDTGCPPFDLVKGNYFTEEGASESNVNFYVAVSPMSVNKGDRIVLGNSVAKLLSDRSGKLADLFVSFYWKSKEKKFKEEDFSDWGPLMKGIANQLGAYWRGSLVDFLNERQSGFFSFEKAIESIQLERRILPVARVSDVIFDEHTQTRYVILGYDESEMDWTKIR